MITSSQKYTVENSEESLIFSVRFKKLWTDTVLVSIEILVSLAIIIYAIFSMATSASDTFIPSALVPFLILFFVLFIIELLWLLYGVELLEVSNAHIVIKHQIFGFGLSKKFRFKKLMACLFQVTKLITNTIGN
jgi:membrane protein YdbS with pleckstrin-like domain